MQLWANRKQFEYRYHNHYDYDDATHLLLLLTNANHCLLHSYYTNGVHSVYHQLSDRQMTLNEMHWNCTQFVCCERTKFQLKYVQYVSDYSYLQFTRKHIETDILEFTDFTIYALRTCWPSTSATNIVSHIISTTQAYLLNDPKTLLVN